MESLPIELIERVLCHLDGASFARSARVAKRWRDAKHNVERTQRVWTAFCAKEMETHVFDQIDDKRNAGVRDADEQRCRRVYRDWWTARRLAQWRLKRVAYSCPLLREDYESVRAVRVSGTLVIVGHRSGRVSVVDAHNDVLLNAVNHLEPVTDLALIDLVGHGHYRSHVSDDYPTRHESYARHHHCVSVSKDNSVHVFAIRDNTARDHTVFKISSVHRNYAAVDVCADMLAVSANNILDISLFRLSLPRAGEVPLDEPMRVSLVRTVYCGQVVTRNNNWFGLFTLSDFKIHCICNQTVRVGTLDVNCNLQNASLQRSTREKWDSICELQVAGDREVSPNYHTFERTLNHNNSVIFANGFAFRNGIFFLISLRNRVYYTLDGEDLRVCPLDERLAKYDKILSVELWGGLMACGTQAGHLFVYDCPNSERLPFINHYKPLFSERICEEPIVQLAISSDSAHPVVVASTKQKIFIFKWTPPDHDCDDTVNSVANDINNVDVNV